MILLADSGSTKTHWCLLTDTGQIKSQATTKGINALMVSADELSARLHSELPADITSQPISAIYYYGAGCVSETVCNNVRNAISNVVPAAKIEVNTDLLAAARAMLADSPGVACILGTGSNSCFYDGSAIVDNVSPLGYILGDEGSGAVLGRLLVGDVLKRQLQPQLCEKFFNQYGLDRLAIINRVYKEPNANRFLASFAPFLSENIDHPQIQTLVLDSFESFFRRNVMNYPTTDNICFVGSIARHFEPWLRKAADNCGLKIAKIAASPMDGLINYHIKHR